MAWVHHLAGEQEDAIALQSSVVEKVMKLLSNHPFVISNPDNAKNIAEFRIFSLKKFKEWLLINYYIFSLGSYILGELKKPLL